MSIRKSNFSKVVSLKVYYERGVLMGGILPWAVMEHDS